MIVEVEIDPDMLDRIVFAKCLISRLMVTKKRLLTEKATKAFEIASLILQIIEEQLKEASISVQAGDEN